MEQPHEGLRGLVQDALRDVSDEVLALAALGGQRQDVTAEELRVQPAPGPLLLGLLGNHQHMTLARIFCPLHLVPNFGNPFTKQPLPQESPTSHVDLPLSQSAAQSVQ